MTDFIQINEEIEREKAKGSSSMGIPDGPSDLGVAKGRPAFCYYLQYLLLCWRPVLVAWYKRCFS